MIYLKEHLLLKEQRNIPSKKMKKLILLEYEKNFLKFKFYFYVIIIYLQTI